MNDQELAQYFDTFFQTYQIYPQIMRQESKLFMVLNRPEGAG